MDQLNKDWKKLQNKVRFVTEVVAEQLVVRNRKKKDLTAELLKKGYDRFPPDSKKTKKGKRKDQDDEEDDQEEESETTDKKASSKPSKEKIMMDNLDKDYDYLLSMKIWSLTAEHIEALKKKLAEKKEELDNLSARTPRDMWEEDLDFFMELWEVFEKELNDFENNVGKTNSKKKIKMPTLHANARLKAKQRAILRAKDRENGKDEMSVDEPSEDSEAIVVKKDTTIDRSKILGPKSAPINKSKTNNSTKVTLKKKDEILTKKGTRTLHDYFSMDTSNSASVSPKKKGKKDQISISSSESPKKPLKDKKSTLSKSQVQSTKDKTKQPPKRKKSQSERKSDDSYYYTETSNGKTDKTDKTDKTSKTERSDSDSVFDSGDNAPSESDSSDSEVTLVSKKPVPRGKSVKKTYLSAHV